MKANKEGIITDILIELERGCKRADCLAIIGKKWQTKERTFDRMWKEANERHKVTQQITQEVMASQSTASTVERLNSAILDKNKALQILTQIAEQETKKTPMGVTSAKSEQISAIKTIAELEGWTAPTKTDNVTTIKVVRE